MSKYYRATNCTRYFESGEEPISFDPIEIVAGVWHGVYKTDDESVHEDLLKYPGVFEISEEEYNSRTQKKTPLSSEFNPLQTLSSAKAEVSSPTVVEDAGPVQSVLQQRDKLAKQAEEKPEVELKTALEVGPTDKVSKPKRGRRKK